MGINPLEHRRYLLRKQLLKLFGGSFRIYDPFGKLAFFASMKAFKLKESITLYTDEAKTEPVILIRAWNIIDFSSAYDVCDAVSGEKLGALRRLGFRSMLKDEWVIMDAKDNEIGRIKEDQWVLAMIRRVVTNVIPQSFAGTIGESTVFEFRQGWNPFASKLHLDFSMDREKLLDRRIGLAAAVLLSAIEGRQD
ncbi:MAG: hypothetical protein ACYC2Y_04020 [Armatimonadota bacterium]